MTARNLLVDGGQTLSANDASPRKFDSLMNVESPPPCMLYPVVLTPAISGDRSQDFSGLVLSRSV